MSQIIPAEHDAKQLELNQQAGAVEDRLGAVRDRMHKLAGDRKEWVGRRQYWRRTLAEIQRDVTASSDPQAAILLAQENDLLTQLAALSAEIEAMESTWRQNRWTRYFPCMNDDGHIHRTLRDCPTVDRGMYLTAMGWATELSGLPVEDAIAKLGPRLCSVCFPDAPAEHCRSLRDITRAEREAQRAQEQAARDAAKAPKTLTGDEVFRTAYGRETVRTVAALKALVRQAIWAKVELEWAQSPARASQWNDPEAFHAYLQNVRDHLAQHEQDAERAAAILVAREAANPGWGADEAAIAKMRVTRERSARKEFGL